jgi:2,3-bisphosphoglycerate-dependent phosphoglycerate mutase
MQLYFIRHGQSENNLLWALTGSHDGRNEDPGLTPVGRQQAQALAEFLRDPKRLTETSGNQALVAEYNPQNVAGFDLTHLYCSLMVRAVQTGQIVARTLSLPLVGWPEIHETGGIHLQDPETGELTGLPGHGRSFFERYYPELVLPDSVTEAGWWNRPFEEHEERPERARRFLEELERRHGGSDDRVAVISHGGFYNHMMRCLLRMPEGHSRWFSMNNTAITRIDFDQETTWIHYTNRCDFLPGELVT